jgi:Flp pilus assembly protein TadB
LQQAGAEVCGVVVVVVIIVRRRRERGRRTTRLNRQLAGFVLGMQV